MREPSASSSDTGIRAGVEAILSAGDGTQKEGVPKDPLVDPVARPATGS
jgi:hypothetical protein